MSAVRVAGPGDGYSRVASGGGLVSLAGHTADREVIARGAGFVSEFDSALARLLGSLEEIGGAPADVLHLRIFVTDMAAYVAARPEIGDSYRERLGGHYPAATLVEVNSLIDGAQVELEGLATERRKGSAAERAEAAPPADPEQGDAVIRLRLAPADSRYANRLAAGSKAMEIFADLETELALREGGDEGLCVAYDMVEFLVPLRSGDFVEGRARVVERGRTSRRVAAEVYKVIEVDDEGVLASGEPVLAARASATIVVGGTVGREER